MTLTLPEHVIDALAAIDADLSRAIVRLAQPELRAAARARRARHLRPPFRHRRHPSRTLERRTGVELVPLPDGRALISFDEPTTIAGLELLIKDALEDAALPAADREIFEAIGEHPARRRGARDHVILLQRNIIVLETRRRRGVHTGGVRQVNNRRSVCVSRVRGPLAVLAGRVRRQQAVDADHPDAGRRRP